MPTHIDPITVLSYGAGIDSTAMLIELYAQGTPPDLVLTADTAGENPVTYQYLAMMRQWMTDRHIENHLVEHEVKRLGRHPPYRGLYQSLLVNNCLPSIAFGRHSCSIKYKITPQDKFIRNWPTAAKAFANGQRIVRYVGLDAGPRDTQRYANAQAIHRPDFDTRFPLREWGWDRDRCAERIRAEGLPLPPKSSCVFCLGMTPEELRSIPHYWHRRIILLEAAAAHRLRTVEGLWRKSTRHRPGSMTQLLETEQYVDQDSIQWIQTTALAHLRQFCADQEQKPATQRRPLDEWLLWFDQ